MCFGALEGQNVEISLVTCIFWSFGGGGDWRKLQAPHLEARTKTSEAKDSGTTHALAWALLRPFRNGVFFSVGLPQAVCLLAWALLRP